MADCKTKTNMEPTGAEQLLHEAVQQQAREYLRKRLTAENLRPAEVDVFTGLLELSEEGSIYATPEYVAGKLDDYRWHAIGDRRAKSIPVMSLREAAAGP